MNLYGNLNSNCAYTSFRFILSRRPHLRCLDLRGANDRVLERLEDFQGFYTDPSFKDSDCELRKLYSLCHN